MFIRRLAYEKLVCRCQNLEYQLRKKENKIVSLEDELERKTRTYAVYFHWPSEQDLDASPVFIENVYQCIVDYANSRVDLRCYSKDNKQIAHFKDVIYFMPCEDESESGNE